MARGPYTQATQDRKLRLARRLFRTSDDEPWQMAAALGVTTTTILNWRKRIRDKNAGSLIAGQYEERVRDHLGMIKASLKASLPATPDPQVVDPPDSFDPMLFDGHGMEELMVRLVSNSPRPVKTRLLRRLIRELVPSEIGSIDG